MGTISKIFLWYVLFVILLWVHFFGTYIKMIFRNFDQSTYWNLPSSKKSFGRYLLYTRNFFTLCLHHGIFETHKCLHFVAHNFFMVHFFIGQSGFVNFLFQTFFNHLLYKSLYFHFINVLYEMCIFQLGNMLMFCAIFQFL